MSSTQLRQRPNGSSTTTVEMQPQRKTSVVPPHAGAGLVAKSMIDTSPQHHGVVLKLHVPVIYTILPEFLRKIILSFSFLSFLAPSWKQRYLILCGSFLYKFKNQVSETPKGSPFDLEGIDVDIVDSSNASTRQEFGGLPPGFTCIFSVSTLRRTHYYAVADKEEALLWVRNLHEARQETITRNMGHAGTKPYPQSWSYFDSLGRNLVKSKERIRERMNDYNMREMEMTTYGEAGPMGRGYYG